MVVIHKKWLYSGKSVCIWVNLFCSGKSGCIRDKVVVFVQKWLYTGKNGSIRAKGGPMNIFRKAQIVQMAESDIFCVK